MKQERYWNYFDRFGNKYQIGLYHGPSGHLVIYCNSNIITIDFNVLQSKTYTFFIGEELFDISIEEKNDIFQYDCQINEEVPTERNQVRKAEAKEEKKYLFIGAGVLLLFMIALIHILG